MKANVVDSNVQFLNLHQELIDGCKKGDQKSQFQIYKLYYKAMYNTSLRIVKDAMEAEDIMQESFLSAFEKISSYSGTVAFGSWLRKIVQNRSLDYLKKINVVASADLECYHEVKDLSAESIEVEEETTKKAGKVREIINHLPERYRKIISLYLFEGYDHEEIGEILSIPSSTSRSQFSRARLKIVNEFEE